MHVLFVCQWYDLLSVNYSLDIHSVYSVVVCVVGKHCDYCGCVKNVLVGMCSSYSLVNCMQYMNVHRGYNCKLWGVHDWIERKRETTHLIKLLSPTWDCLSSTLCLFFTLVYPLDLLSASLQSVWLLSVLNECTTSLSLSATHSHPYLICKRK